MDDDPTSDFGSIITGVDDNIDAIVSGPHPPGLQLLVPGPGWDGPCGDRASGRLGGSVRHGAQPADLHRRHRDRRGPAKTQALLNLKTAQQRRRRRRPFNYPADPATTAIVNDAVAAADALGAVALGKIGGPFIRASSPTARPRTAVRESTLGNLVAEVQRWATRTPGGRCGADRVHEPGWSACGHGRHRTGALPAHADLQAGRRSSSRSPTRW